MRAASRKEAGSAATLSSLKDATAVSPASRLSSAENRWLAVVPTAFSFATADQPKLDGNLQNLTAALESGLFGVFRWDEFAHTEVLEKNGIRTELQRAEITLLIVECQQRGFANISRRSFEEVVHLVAKKNEFDSAQEWLNGLPSWDGTPRIERFLPDYLGTVGRPYELAVGRYWWTAMAARIIFPGCKADMVPVLVGPQGVGKSTVLSAIAPTPQHCGEACLSDRSSLRARKVQAKTLVVWEELRGIQGKHDADEVKTFITSPYVEVRNRTKERMDRVDRRFVLVGTANTKDILRDTSGNRRFLPFDVPRAVVVDKVRVDRIQLWAEALQMVKNRVARGETAVDFQDAERLAKNEHSAYFRESRWAGEKRLLSWLEHAADRFSTEQALDAIGLSPVQVTLREKRDMAATLRQLGYDNKVPSRVPGMKNPQPRWRKV